MLVDMDGSVGRILGALEQAGLDENTIVVYASDHGAMKPGLNDPLRDFKGTLFEGGIRIPCIARWPGRLEKGSQSNQVGTLMDITASILAAAGTAPLDGKPLDGVDILGHVASGKPDFPRTLFWRQGSLAAASDGRWKLVRTRRGTELFDLAADPGESADLAGERPADLIRLQGALEGWEAGLAEPGWTWREGDSV